MRLALAVVILVGCSQPARAPSNVAAGDATPSTASDGSCYPYLRAVDGSCRTSCTSIDHCAGSRGPGDLAEHGWPLDCIQDQCVPLPPEHVHPSPD
jgi:hypothetical protein